MLREFWYTILFHVSLASHVSDDFLETTTYCGLQHTGDYVRNNSNITLDELPWIAQLLYDEEKRVECVGSLINQQYILTAAHCLISSNREIKGVRFGNYDVTTGVDCTNHTTFGEEYTDPVQEFVVDAIIVHSGFRRRRLINDIGLVRLSDKVYYSEYIRPICLPAFNTIEIKGDDQLTASSWGAVDFSDNPTKIIKKNFGTLISLEECRDLYNNNSRKLITENHLCVVEDVQFFTCLEDSGGPLMLSVKGQWYQIGIFSFRMSCGGHLPTVYTKVNSYLDWIKENVRS